MKTLLIKNALHEGILQNILVEDGRFKKIGADAATPSDAAFDAAGAAILPAFYNTHTHAAMTLLRGYADDMPLQKWLNEYIWPYEAKMTGDDIHKGSEIAVKEMIKSGSVFFSDMYFDIERTVEVVDRLGIRAALGITFMESHSKAQQADKLAFMEQWQDPTGGRISLTVAPHAIYTVGRDLLVKCAEIARSKGLRLHIHLAETLQEVEDCKKLRGTTPVRYLDSLGFLGPDVIAAHVVHVDHEEAAILAERGVSISHCPCSNMKLASGIFPYRTLMDAGCRITLGTDGASSGNNLDMREAMKFAALLAKVSSGDPALLPAEEVFRWATRCGAEAFGLDAGEIREGLLADAVFVDMQDINMQPCHNLVSNWVYSADSRAIKNVMCDGRILL